MPEKPEFHFRIPSRGWRTAMSAISPLVFVVASAYLVSQNPADVGLWLFLVLVTALFLFAVTVAVVGFRNSSAFEFRVDSQSVYWRSPWPWSAETRIKLTPVEAIEKRNAVLGWVK